MSRIYRFGNCRIEPARRELWRDDQLVELPPLTFDFLAYLIERHDRAVGRDELVASVWGKTEISDTVLGQTVLRLRREFGDDGKGQRFLRTIPRYGYHWVAPLTIERVDTPAPAAEPAAEPVAEAATIELQDTPARAAEPMTEQVVAPRRRWRRPWRTGFVAGAVVVFLSVGLLLWRWPAPPSPALQLLLASAVLPAEVDSSAEWSWMRLGLMDMIASRLRSAGVPSVPSEEVVALLSAPNRPDVREATGSRLLITPRVQREAGGWRVTLDAIDAQGQHYFAQAQEADVQRAARTATDRLLAALGVQAPSTEHDMPSAELVKRVDAAVLAGDVDAAHRLIDGASDAQRAEPELRLRLAKLDFRAGRLGPARERLQALLDEAPAATAPILRASILNGLGVVALRDDKTIEAQTHFGAAIELLQAHPDAEQLGQAYLGRAAAAAEQHRSADARADYARARVAYRDANDALASFRVSADEGFLDLDEDRPAQALLQLRAASEGFRRWGAQNEAVYAYIGRIQCHLALLDARAAMQDADEAAALAQHTDNPDVSESLTLARARALVAVGRLREARATLDELRSTTKDASAAAAGGVLATLELEAKNFLAADTLARSAVAALEIPSYAALRADAWLSQVRSAVRRGDAPSSAESVAAFEAWAQQRREPRVQVLARLARAEFSQRFGGDRNWRAQFDATRELAESNAVPLEIALVARAYAEALLSEGDLDGAVIEVGRVTRWSEQDFACAVLEARLFAALGRDAPRQAALARARALAGERPLPADALTVNLPVRAAAVP